MPACPSGQTLQQFLDETLDAAKLSDLTSHLERCPACQAVCEKLTAAEAQFPVPPLPIVGDAETADIVRRLKDRTRLNLAEENPEPREDLARFATGQTIGSYRLLHRIAAGAQGILFRAWDQSLDRLVAVKVLSPSSVSSGSAKARFLREGKMAASLRSDYIVPLYQIGGEQEDIPYLVMEYVEGETLRERQARQPALAQREIAQIIREIALGLAAAHARGVVHRDIKPSNILLDRRTGRARITDFGLALDATELSRMTADGAIAGTPAYMSPEQVVSPEAVDPRSDIYSLGIVMYELLAEEVPFRGVVRTTLLQVVHDDPRPPSVFNDQVAADLETICLRAIAKEPHQRFASALELAEELQRWLEGAPILSRPLSSLQLSWRWCQRHWLVASLCAAIVLLLTGLAGVAGVAAWQLAEANAEAQRQARIAGQQRDALMETVLQLTHEFQREFDKETMDIDKVQEDSLRIALEGLKKASSIPGGSNAAELVMATASRRLGEIMHNLDRPQEAAASLTAAERALRERLKANVADIAAKQELVRVYHTQLTNSEAEQESDLEPEERRMLGEMVELAESVVAAAPSVEAKLSLAEALLIRSEYRYLEPGKREFAQQDAVAAAKLFSEFAPGEDEVQTERAAIGWLKSADLRAQMLAVQHQSRESRQWIEATLSSFSQKYSRRARRSVHVQEMQLGLLDRWGDLQRASPDAPFVAPPEHEQITQRFQQIALADEADYLNVVSSLTMLAATRELEEDYPAAVRFTELEVEISRRRCEQNPGDREARRLLRQATRQLAELREEAESGDTPNPRDNSPPKNERADPLPRTGETVP